MPMLQIYTIFHINLAYSSIEDERRQEVIEKCYWPLLQMVKDIGFPCGIEASAYSLAEISRLDSSWIEELRRLIKNNQIEFIGSGFAQIISPLLPEKLNKANIFHANQVYNKLLDVVPSIALVNEQAFSNGLISLYLEAGYKGIIMEWNNAAAAHPEWQSEWRYYPQLAEDKNGRSIPIIWSDSINFQQFQRYVHGDIEIDMYEKFIDSHQGKSTRVMSLYANDTEIFDFRPGRYHAEAELMEAEWKKIRELFLNFNEKRDMQFIFPSDILSIDYGNAKFNKIDLSSAELPIPVKKQGKYNLLRWAVSGRNDLDINTRCWRLFSKIKNAPIENSVWPRLCRLWASDYRTHITQARWNKYLKELDELESEFDVIRLKANEKPLTKIEPRRIESINNAGTQVELDTRRGLSIRACYFNKSDISLFGLLPHGFFHDIRYVADWYSGHMTYEASGHHKITDLCASIIAKNDKEISAEININCFGKMKKSLLIDEDGGLVLNHHFQVETNFDGVWRSGFITLNSKAFNKNTLFYATHNGGGLETFVIKNEFDHGGSISHLVSANCGLGATQGVIIIGDAEKQLEIKFDHAELAVVPMLSFSIVDDSYLLRLCFSLRELDDTRKYQVSEKLDYNFSLHIRPLYTKVDPIS